MLNQGIWLLLYQSCLIKHNAEDWCNLKVAKSLLTTFYHSIRYLCINQIRNNRLSVAKIIKKWTCISTHPLISRLVVISLFDFNHLQVLVFRFRCLARKFDAKHSITHASIDGILHYIFRKDECLLEFGV